MSLYAILHSADPGSDYTANVMCERHDDVFLDVRFVEENLMRIEAHARFIATKNVRPQFVTLWDGPYYRATVPITFTDIPDMGSTITVNLTWTVSADGSPVK